MKERDERPFDDLDAIDEVVRLQQRVAQRCARYAAESIERLQTGRLDAGDWIGAYGRFASEAADDFFATIRAMSKLRGPW